MINLNDFINVKDKISKLFKDRKGFTDEVVNAITASYIYFEKNYPEEIPLDQVPDAKHLSQIKSESTGVSIGKIYLNRILNNVQEFVHNTSPSNCSEFVALEKKVYVPDIDNPDWNNRVGNWNIKDLNDEQKEILKKKIRAKVITHELIHAGSFNGQSIGFTYSSLGKTIDENKLKQIRENYKTEPYNVIYGQNLEEMITEVLALNIVENHRVETTKNLGNSNGSITFRNRDSSNYSLNPLAEYVMLTYPEIVNYKFTDGLKFLADFNDDHEINLNRKSNWTYIALFNTCDSIKNGLKTNDQQSSINKLMSLQFGCLNKYKKHIEINNIEDLSKCLLDVENFKLYATKENGKIEEHLSTLITEITTIIKEQSQKIGVSWKDYVQHSTRINNDFIAKSEELNLPYFSLINSNSTNLTI